MSVLLCFISDCGLLIVMTSAFSPLFFLSFLFLCVRVRVYLRMYVCAYLAIPCVSANDNVKHTNSNLKYDKKIKRKKGRKRRYNENQQPTVTHIGENKRLHLESSKQNYYIISL